MTDYFIHHDYVLGKKDRTKSQKKEEPVCEVCGKRATQMIQDSRLNKVKVREPIGPPHYFCNAHTREPKT